MARNIADFFAQHLDRPGAVLFRQHSAGTWRDVTAGEIATLSARWQAAFRRTGLATGDRIALCARNGINWVAIDLAALGLGLVVVPLYVDDNPDNVAWCAANVEARLLIVENDRLAAALSLLGGTYPLPPLVALGAGDGDTPVAGIRLAESVLPDEAEPFRVMDLPTGTLATICYTSGTAGRPKGVMLSHENIIADVMSCQAVHMARPTDRFLSMLPLSHMFERTGGYYLPLSIGARVAFARGTAHFADDLVTQEPTVVFAVPRIFDRFMARIDRALAKSPLRKALFAQCAERGYRLACDEASTLDRLLVPILRRFVGVPVLAHLGGCLRLAVVGGAPLDPALARTLIGLGLTMLQGYGMTEAAPVVSVNRERDNEPESVGPPLPGIEVKVAQTGELLVRGGNVMLGYWRDPEATRAAIDAEGWLHTGDLGEIIAGKIYLRGRAKDVLVLSNGEKLAPQDVEISILHDAMFEQVMLIGEGRPFVVLLAVTKENDEKALMRRANEQLKAYPRWVRVRHVIPCSEPWSIDNGLLTPTLKLRRPLVLARFKDRIDAAYAAAGD